MAGAYSKLTEKVINYLNNLDLQQANKFEFVILPRLIATSKAQAALSVLAFTVGNVLFKFQIQEISIPFIEYEMGTAERGIKYIKDIKYPETFTVKLLDDEKGTAVRAINGWMSLIGTPNFLETGRTDVVTPTGTKIPYMDDDAYFAPDLQFMKLNCLLKLIGNRDSGTSLIYPTILFRKCMPRKINEWKLSQDSEEFITVEVEFSVDQIIISNLV